MLGLQTVHDSWVRAAVFHPCGKLVVSVGEDKNLKVTHITEQRVVATVPKAHKHFITSLAVSRARPIMVTGGMDKLLHVWDCK